MTLHVIAYRSLELLFRKHAFNFNCFIEDLNCVFTQVHCLSRVLPLYKKMPLKLKKHDTGPKMPLKLKKTIASTNMVAAPKN